MSAKNSKSVFRVVVLKKEVSAETPQKEEHGGDIQQESGTSHRDMVVKRTRRAWRRTVRSGGCAAATDKSWSQVLSPLCLINQSRQLH